MGNIVHTVVIKCVLKAFPFAMVLQLVRGSVLTILAFDGYCNFISEILNNAKAIVHYYSSF